MMEQFEISQLERVETARRLAHEIITSGGARWAFLGGSPFAGLGTTCSDIDLFIVQQDLEKRSTVNQQFGVERVDTETWPMAHLVNAANIATSFAVPESTFEVIRAADRYSVRALIRLAQGEILIDEADQLAALRRTLLSRYPAFVKFQCFSSAIPAANEIEDAAGFLDAGEIGPAVYTARNAVLAAAEAKLSQLGDPYPGDKWIWARWKRSGDDSIGVDLLRWLDCPPIRREGALGLLWLAQDLLLQAITATSYRMQPDPLAILPVRNPWAAPIPTSTAILVFRPGVRTARISDQGALLLGLSHGRSREDAVNACLESLATSGIDVTAADVDKYYQSLVDAKLVGPLEAFRTSRG